nr:unnamed protein product [Naegleria fowleri]
MHQELEQERKKIKDRKLHEKMIEKQKRKEEMKKKMNGESSDKQKEDDDNSSSDDDEYFSSSDSGDEDLEQSARNGKKEVKTASVSQSMRTREDIPKYLYNLELDSAHYDPKTRSMRGNPLPFVDPSEATYVGDNALKKSGEYQEFIQAQKFMWDAGKRGEDINLAAVPTQAFMGFSTFLSKKKELEESRKKAVIERYGGEKFLNKPTEFESAQTENYAEYSTSGRIIGGKQQATIKSKYEEDMYYNGHTSVFGSYWDPKKGWGFKCCKQFDRKSYCTNISPQTNTATSPASSSTVHSSNGDVLPPAKSSSQNTVSATNNKTQQPRTTNLTNNNNHASRQDGRQDGKQDGRVQNESSKPKKDFAVPIPQEKKRKVDEKTSWNEKKTKYSGYDHHNYTVSEQEMEEYRKNKTLFDDPMKDYKD